MCVADVDGDAAEETVVALRRRGVRVHADVADESDGASRCTPRRASASAASTSSTTTPASRRPTTPASSRRRSTRGSACRTSTPRACSSAASTASRTCSSAAAARSSTSRRSSRMIGAATSQISYTASKGAVLAMSRELAVQFARRGIRVNALCPGTVDTPMLRSIWGDDPDGGATAARAHPRRAARAAARDRQRRALSRERRVVVRQRRRLRRRRRRHRRVRHSRIDLAYTPSA